MRWTHRCIARAARALRGVTRCSRSARRRHCVILQVLALLVHCLCTDELVLRRRACEHTDDSSELGGCSRVWTRECARLF